MYLAAQADKADTRQHQGQTDEFLERELFLKEKARPEQSPDVAQGHHGIEHGELPVPEAQAVKNRRAQVERNAQRQVTVEESQDTAVGSPHGAQLEKHGAEGADYGSAEDQYNRAERCTGHFFAPWPRTATPIMMLTMPISLGRLSVS